MTDSTPSPPDRNTTEVTVRARLSVFSGYATALYMVRLTALAKSAILARMLGPADYGSLAAFTTFLAYGAFLDLGLFNGQNREIPIMRGAGDLPGARHVAAVARTGSVIIAAFAALFLAVVGALQASGQLAGSWWFSVGLAVAILGQQSTGVMNSLCYAEQRFSLQARALLTGALVDVCVSIPAGLLWGARGVISVWVVGIVAQWLALRHGIGPIGWRFDAPAIKRLSVIGIPIAVVWFANTNLVGVDKLVILSRLGTTDLGLYSIAGVAGVLVTIGPNAVSQMLQPKILSLFGRDGHGAGSVRLVRMGQSVSGFVGGSLAALGCAVLPFVVATLLPAYVSAVPAAVVLMVASAIFSTLHPVAGYFIIHERQLGLAALYLSVAVFNVVLDIALIEVGLGITGVAIGSLVTYVLLYGMVQWWLNRIAVKDETERPNVLSALQPGALALYGTVVASFAYIVSRNGRIEMALVATVVVCVAMAPGAMWLSRRYVGTDGIGTGHDK